VRRKLPARTVRRGGSTVPRRGVRIAVASAASGAGVEPTPAGVVQGRRIPDPVSPELHGQHPGITGGRMQLAVGILAVAQHPEATE